jgi:hypothetical protein
VSLCLSSALSSSALKTLSLLTASLATYCKKLASSHIKASSLTSSASCCNVGNCVSGRVRRLPYLVSFIRFCADAMMEQHDLAFKRAVEDIEKDPDVIPGPDIGEREITAERSKPTHGGFRDTNEELDLDTKEGDSEEYLSDSATGNKDGDIDSDESWLCDDDSEESFVKPVAKTSRLTTEAVERKPRQPQSEKSDYEKLRDRNVAEKEAALRASGVLEEVVSYKERYLGGGRKGAATKTGAGRGRGRPSKVVKCPQCSVTVPSNLLRTHTKFYHYSVQSAPQGRVSRDRHGKSVKCPECREAVPSRLLSTHKEFYHYRHPALPRSGSADSEGELVKCQQCSVTVPSMWVETHREFHNQQPVVRVFKVCSMFWARATCSSLDYDQSRHCEDVPGDSKSQLRVETAGILELIAGNADLMYVAAEA